MAPWLLSLLCALPAAAGNDDGVPVGIEAAQSGGAITATISAGAAGFYNPAGVAGGSSNSVDVSANAYGLRLYRVEQLVTGPEGEHQGERVVDWVIAPTLLSYVRKLSPRWYASFGLFVPKTTDYILQSTLNTVEGARWFVTRAERSNEYYAGGTAALRITPTLRIGLSLLGVYTAQAYGLTEAGGLDQRTLSLIVQTSAKSYELTMRAGVQWEPLPKLAIGLSVYAPNVIAAQRIVVGAAFTGPSISDPERQNFEIIQETRRNEGRVLGGAPGVRLGAAYRHARGWLALDGTLNLPLHAASLVGARQTEFNLRAGMSQDLTASWRLGAGLFTDRNASREDGIDYYGLTFGASNTRQYDLRDGGVVRFVTSISARYAYGRGTLSGSLVPSLNSATPEFVDYPTEAVSQELSVSIGSGVSF